MEVHHGRIETEEQNRSLKPPWAYLIFGWLLGTIAPFILFLSYHVASSLKFGNSLIPSASKDTELLLLPLLLNVICSVAGAIVGLLLGLAQFIFWRKPWIYPVVLSPILGIIWAIVAGGAGGVLIFIVGAIIGVIVAAPYSFFGFIIFAAIYEPLARRREMRWWNVALLALGIVILLSLVVSPLLMLLLYQRDLRG